MRISVIFRIEILGLLACFQWSAAQVPDSLSIPDAATFRIILTEKEKKEFDKYKSAQDKAQWANLYWKRLDPTPTTSKNERLEEYDNRVAYALKFYKAFTLEGFDDRGLIYLKYGEPYQKYTEPVGTSFARANESWSYSQLYPGLTFDFISDGTSYYLTNDFRKAVVSKSTSNLISIFESRSDLDLKYQVAAHALQYEGIEEALSEFASESQKSQIEAPVVSYSYDYQRKPLHLMQRAAQFKGPHGNVRLELYYGIPVNELKFYQRDQYWATPVAGKVAIFDSLYNTISTDSFTVDLRVKNKAATQTGAYTSQSNFNLPTGAYITVRYKQL